MSAHISKTAALALIKTARELFLAGTGTHLDHDNDENLPPGLIDDINPEQGELFYWANELLRFARVVHGILTHAIMVSDEIGDGSAN